MALMDTLSGRVKKALLSPIQSKADSVFPMPVDAVIIIFFSLLLRQKSCRSLRSDFNFSLIYSWTASEIFFCDFISN